MNIGYGVKGEVQSIGRRIGVILLVSLDGGNGTVNVVSKGSGSIEC